MGSVKNSPVVIMLVKWLPDVDLELQSWLSTSLYQMCTADMWSLTQCCNSGINSAILECLQKRNSLDTNTVGMFKHYPIAWLTRLTITYIFLKKNPDVQVSCYDYVLNKRLQWQLNWPGAVYYSLGRWYLLIQWNFINMHTDKIITRESSLHFAPSCLSTPQKLMLGSLNYHSIIWYIAWVALWPKLMET